jgi:hypothetical protein
LPTLTAVGGVPLIVGARLPVPDTVIENGASATHGAPSVTAMTMFVYVPTFDALGVPANLPVDGSNDAQPGLWLIEKAGAPAGPIGRPGALAILKTPALGDSSIEV